MANRRDKKPPPGMRRTFQTARTKTDAGNVLFSVLIIHVFPQSVYTQFATEDHHAGTVTNG